MSNERVSGGQMAKLAGPNGAAVWARVYSALQAPKPRILLSGIGLVAVLAVMAALFVVRMQYAEAYSQAQQARDRQQAAQQALALRQAQLQVARQREQLLRFARESGLWQGDWVPVQLSLQNSTMTSGGFGVAMADMLGGARKIPDLASFDLSVAEPGFDLFGVNRSEGSKQVVASVNGRVWVGRESGDAGVPGVGLR